MQELPSVLFAYQMSLKYILLLNRIILYVISSRPQLWIKCEEDCMRETTTVFQNDIASISQKQQTKSEFPAIIPGAMRKKDVFTTPLKYKRNGKKKTPLPSPQDSKTKFHVHIVSKIKITSPQKDDHSYFLKKQNILLVSGKYYFTWVPIEISQ